MGAGRSGRGVAEIAVGWKAAPALVAAVQQIEADRAGHDRNYRGTDPEAAAPFGEPGLHAAAGFQPERRTARERDAVISLDGIGEVERRAFADTGSAAAYIDRRHGRSIENHRGDAGR